MDKPDLKEKVLLNLRSVTQSCKGGVPIDRLERDYRDLLGTRIPFKDLGYNSLEAFIRSIPDVISLRKGREGKLMAEGVADSSTAHIASLVSRQKQTKPATRGSRKSYFSRRRGGFSPRNTSYRPGRSSYGSSSSPPYHSSARTFKQDRVPSVPKYHSRSPPRVSTVNNSIPAIQAPLYPKANTTVSAPARKYEVAPRFLRLQQRKMEAEEARSISPPVAPPKSVSPPPQPSPLTSLSGRVSYRTNKTSSTSGYNNDDVYNGNQMQKSPRPLLSKSNMARLDTFKQQLESAESSKEYVEIYAKINSIPIKYITNLMGQRKKGFVSNLHLGEKVYRSYPNVARSEDEAEEIAAQSAVESIRESKEYLAAQPETSIRNADEIQILLNRIEEIVCDKPSGMFTNGIVKEYENKFNELLPECWLDLLKQSSVVDIEEIDVPYGRVPDGINFIVRPSKFLSSGSTTPSETSSKMNAEQLDLESEDFSSKNIVNHHVHSQVPDLVIPDGNEWNVFITNTSTFITARLIDYDQDFLEMLNMMAAFYDSQALPVSEVFEKQLYATTGGRVNGQLVMHRVLANKILDNDLVECYYVDEGIIAEIHKSDLQEICEEFLTVPYQAIHLAFDGLDDYEPFIQPEHLEPSLYKTYVALIKRWCPPLEDYLPDDPGIHRVIYSVILYDTSDKENDICINDIIKKQVLDYLVCKLPELGVSSRGYLTHVTESGQIYLRFLHPENSWLEMELEKYSSAFEESCFKKTVLTSGQVYAAKFEDGKWYRAKLFSNSSASDPQMIEVIFIDYGHPSLVRRSDICEIEPHSEFLSLLGNQAIICELFNALPTPNTKWNAAAIAKLMELAPFNEELIVRVMVEDDGNSLAKVNLHKRIFTKEDSLIISINENLANRLELFPEFSASESVATARVPNHLNLQYNNTPHRSKGSLSSFVPIVATPVDESVINSVRKMGVSTPTNEGIEWVMTPDNIKSPDAYEDESPVPLSPPDVPAKGEDFAVFVTMAATPHNFVVQPLKTASYMTELMNQMQQFYSVEENLIEMHPSLLKKNSFYAALHSDNSWYRVRLVSVSAADPVMAAVYYVDFGDFNTVSLQNLQKLWRQFRNLPCQAIKASLSGVMPLQKDWNPEHCVKFIEMVTEKRFFSIVQKKHLKEELEFSSVEVELTLIDTSNPNQDIYIHELLIEKSMARAAPF